MVISSSAKRSRIHNAAARLFLEAGYSETSIDSIAEKARVSKPTVYKHFITKEGLFREVIQQLCEDRLVHFIPPSNISATIQESLKVLAHHYLDTMLQPGTIAIIRVIIAETLRFPDLARYFHILCVDRYSREIANCLSMLNETGLCGRESALLATDHFLGMLKESFLWPEILGVRGEFSQEERERFVNQAVETIMRAYGL